MRLIHPSAWKGNSPKFAFWCEELLGFSTGPGLYQQLRPSPP
jgi:hypothetical protein